MLARKRSSSNKPGSGWLMSRRKSVKGRAERQWGGRWWHYKLTGLHCNQSKHSHYTRHSIHQRLSQTRLSADALPTPKPWNSGAQRSETKCKFLLVILKKEIELENWNQMYKWRVEGVLERTFLQRWGCCWKTRYSTLLGLIKDAVWHRVGRVTAAISLYCRSCCVHTFFVSLKPDSKSEMLISKWQQDGTWRRCTCH